MLSVKDLNDSYSISEVSHPQFLFDSAQVMIVSMPINLNPFVFHFQSPDGGTMEFVDDIKGNKYEASISEEFSRFAFMALDSIFVLKTVPIILSREDFESYDIGHTPPEMVFKIYKDGELIVDEKIVLLNEAAGYVTTYSPLFDRLKKDLFNVKAGMFEYWFHFKENSGPVLDYRYYTSSSTEEK